jgi:3-oxoacyl-[acyl-carrier protein] reductase
MNKIRMIDNQCALVTGASRGIGRAIAESLAEAGCDVAITSRNLQDCQAVASEIAARYGVNAIGLQADVSQPESIHELFQHLEPWAAGRFEILVCNAGFPMRPEIWNTPLAATPAEKLQAWYLDAFSTDAMGSVFCTFEALRLMVPRRSGKIIYISSTPALEGFQGGPYTMAKAAVLGLMKDVAREYGKDNIRANALALGNILTPATFDSLDAQSREALAEEAPMRRWGSPAEVGNAALFLASDLSSFITGQVLVIDGGTIRR